MDALPLDLFTAKVIPLLSIEKMCRLYRVNRFFRDFFKPFIYREFSRRMWAALKETYETKYPMLWEIVCLPNVVFISHMPDDVFYGRPISKRVDIVLDTHAEYRPDELKPIFDKLVRIENPNWDPQTYMDDEGNEWFLFDRHHDPSRINRRGCNKHNFDGCDIYMDHSKPGQGDLTKYMKIQYNGNSRSRCEFYECLQTWGDVLTYWRPPIHQPTQEEWEAEFGTTEEEDYT